MIRIDELYRKMEINLKWWEGSKDKIMLVSSDSDARLNYYNVWASESLLNKCEIELFACVSMHKTY